jgi:NADPH:quinone reductase-like Zn-dependent oxidoreductase
MTTGVPATSRAVTFREFGGPEVLKVEQVPTPEPGPGEVLVRVEAVSVGRLLDVVARSGRHPYAKFEFPHVLGAEHAGTVAALGDGVEGVSVGARVAVFPIVLTGEDRLTRAGRADLSPRIRLIGTHLRGAYADYAVAPAGNLLPIPDGMSAPDAVALVLAASVAVHQFEQAGGIGPDSRVIVQGATSALGSTTALYARHLGATVIVGSREPAKRERLAELGFEHVMDASDPEFAARARELFDGEGADVVVDNLGEAGLWSHSCDALAPGGAIVSSGAFLGREVTVNLQRLYSQGHRLVGVRSGTLDAAHRAWQEVDRGFRSVVDRTFALDDAPAAHAYVEAGGNVGRVALVTA